MCQIKLFFIQLHSIHIRKTVFLLKLHHISSITILSLYQQKNSYFITPLDFRTLEIIRIKVLFILLALFIINYLLLLFISVIFETISLEEKRYRL